MMSRLAAANEVFAKGLVEFVNNSPSPFHAVESAKTMLSRDGFTELCEKDPWSLRPGCKYYITKNHSSLIAFTVGEKYKSGNGFTMIGAHTDSPCLKVKPRCKKSSDGYHQLAVCTYGGGIWYTWFDRELSIAGRVLLQSSNDPKALTHRLIRINKPVLSIPTIAIHLNRDYGVKWEISKQQHLLPILATEEIYKDAVGDENASKSDERCPLLMQLLCEQLHCKPANIVDFELCLHDAHPAAIGGVFNEFVYAPRLDNLFSCYAALCALSGTLGTLDNEPNVRLISLYDNEECGSESAQGAQSQWTKTVIDRIVAELGSGEAGASTLSRTLSQSLLLSADQAHAVHPNYSALHEPSHRPAMHGGPVIKLNYDQRYATTGWTAAAVRQCAALAGVPVQEFVVRNDAISGTTIGPILSAKLGVATCDIGCPQLSMHSCREMCGTLAVKQAVDLFKSFFNNVPDIVAKLVQ